MIGRDEYGRRQMRTRSAEHVSLDQIQKERDLLETLHRLLPKLLLDNPLEDNCTDLGEVFCDERIGFQTYTPSISSLSESVISTSRSEAAEKLRRYVESCSDLRVKLRQFENKFRHLGGGIHARTSLCALRHLLDKLELPFQRNIERLHDGPTILPGDAMYYRATYCNTFTAFALALWSLYHSLTAFCDEFYETECLEPLKILAEFVEVQSRLIYAQNDTDGQQNAHDTQIHLVDILPLLSQKLDAVAVGLSQFLDLVVPVIWEAQQAELSRYLNMTLIATFLSAVTATTLQFSFAQASTTLTIAINTFWFCSLIFSTSSAVNSLLGLTWRQAPQSTLVRHLPPWASVWLIRGPMISLTVASATFSIGLCLFAFSSQHIVTSILTSAFTSMHAIGLFALARFFIYDQQQFEARRIYSLLRTLKPKSLYAKFGGCVLALFRKNSYIDHVDFKDDVEMQQTHSDQPRPPGGTGTTSEQPSNPFHGGLHLYTAPEPERATEIGTVQGTKDQYVPFNDKFPPIAEAQNNGGTRCVSYSLDGKMICIGSTEYAVMIGEFLLPEVAREILWSDSGEFFLARLHSRVSVWSNTPVVYQGDIQLAHEIQAIEWARNGRTFYAAEKDVIHHIDSFGSILNSFAFPGWLIIDITAIDNSRLVCIAEFMGEQDLEAPNPQRDMLGVSAAVDYTATSAKVMPEGDGLGLLVSYRGQLPPELYSLAADVDSVSASSDCTRIGLQLTLRQTFDRPERRNILFRGESIFASVDHNLVVSSTEAGDLFIWSRDTGKILRHVRPPPAPMGYQDPKPRPSACATVNDGFTSVALAYDRRHDALRVCSAHNTEAVSHQTLELNAILDKYSSSGRPE
ncbi:hypothetical protein DFH11DRAFT_1607422 [Phellopilus nigrolimitatus]|nr:hypothetical protein DFH11DRAFT_1607422 [Phellopilus nigrolimitatus]